MDSFSIGSALLLGCALACSDSTTVTNNLPDSSTDSNASDSAKPSDGAAADVVMGNCSPACAGAGYICDPADNKCKPDGTTTNVGAPCTMNGTDPVCGTNPDATCYDEPNEGFPGGYCSVDPCSATSPCAVGASCAGLSGFPPTCWKNCNSVTDCRSPGYECLTVDPFWVSGASHKVCYLADYPCSINKDCPASKPTCNGYDPDAGAGSGSCQ
jgi:hypothetical protein